MKVSELIQWLETERADAEVVVESGGVLHTTEWLPARTMNLVIVKPDDEWTEDRS